MKHKKATESDVKKEPIYELNFVRAFCAIVIILFHFSCHSASESFKPCYLFANGSWGGTIVSSFFILSGGLLYYNNSALKGGMIQKYFKKRWFALFPMFYIVYAFFALQKILDGKTFFYRGGNIVSYIPTVLGIDGYISNGYHGVNYYLVGEWFLGAIIILQVLYPFVLLAFQKNKVLLGIIVVGLYISAMFFPLSNPDPFRTISSCLLSFVLGIYLIFFRNIFFSRLGAYLSIGVCCCLYFVKLPISENTSMHLLGCGIVIIGYQIGSLVKRFSLVFRFVNYLSGISYAIFLAQHRIILAFLERWNPKGTLKSSVLLLLIIITIIVFADAFTAFDKVIAGRIKNFEKIIVMQRIHLTENKND